MLGDGGMEEDENGKAGGTEIDSVAEETVFPLSYAISHQRIVNKDTIF